MPDVANVLRFRPRVTSASLSREDVDLRADEFLASELYDSESEVDRTLGVDGDVLTAVCKRLGDVLNEDPRAVGEKAPRLYRYLCAKSSRDFFFDERDFFLGESALLAAGASRLLGKKEETELWLDRADANFRHTVSPSPQLARVAYIRLTLRYQTRRHEEVLELLPSVTLTFEKLGMENDEAKCRFLEAMSLKELGRVEESSTKLERLAFSRRERVDQSLYGMALVNLGDLRSEKGCFDSALAAYKEAMPLLQAANRHYALADLKVMVGGTLRKMGQLTQALGAYRDAVQDHVNLGMATRVAYLRILFAEVLLEAGKVREAEWEILAALPTIDQEQMVPEGFAAAALLRESVRQRNPDSNALFELREYLQASN